MVKKIFLMALVLLLPTQKLLFANEALQPKTNKLAADFTLSNLENKEASLSDFRGKGVLLFFWATWCPYCLQELKELNKTYAGLKKDGVELLAIDVGEPRYKVDNFVKTHNLDFGVFLDKDMAVAETYGLIGVPTYILIDKAGYIVFKDHYFPKQEYKGLI